MPEQVDKYVKALKEKGCSEDKAWAICQSQFADAGITRAFADSVEYNPTEKTAISIRDGVIEYFGSELGVEPAEKVFTVYRSPATIAKAAQLMPGIPFTDEHVSIDEDPPETGSTVLDAEVVDLWDDRYDARMGVKNRLTLTDAAIEMLRTKKELSLGYRGRLVPHSKYDYEQRDIEPHHLAGVPVGRCGSACSFIDRKPITEESHMAKKMFFDQEGTVNLEQIVQMATELPEAIKSVPLDKLQEIMPSLMEIVSYAKDQGVQVEDEEVTEEVPEVEEEEMEDEKKFSDADVKAKVEQEKVKFADAEVKRYAEVVTKARNFLDADYDFAGKTANEVMRDALATQSTDKFEDAELSVAFKLLRKPDTDYSKFGDSQPEGALSARIKKQLEEA